MGPEQARTAVERLLLRRWHEREKLIVRLPLARLDIRPGSLVRLPGEPDILEVISSTVESSTVVLELRRSRQDLPLSLDGDPGRAIVPADVIGDPTRLLLVEPPALGDAPLSEPVLVLAASGGQVPWRTVGIELSTDGYTEQAHARRRAVLGEACTELFPGQASPIDRINDLDVQLAGPDDWMN